MKFKNFKNFTPHTVNVYKGKDIIASFPPEGIQIRVNEKTLPHNDIGGVPVVRKKYTTIYGLPEMEKGVYLIVSAMVLQASDRSDLVCPDTGPDSVVRDRKNNIIGVRRFQVM